MAKQHKEKKLSTTLKVVITLAVLVVIFFALALSSAIYSVDRTIKAIDAIGTVEYTAASKQKIDTANDYYGALDINLGLQKRITNADALERAKLTYAGRVIYALHVADGENDESGTNDALVLSLIEEARAVIEQYFTSDESANIPNYKYLTDAEARYGSTGGGTQNNTPSDGDGEIEIC